VVERGWIGHDFGAYIEPFAYVRREAEPINQLAIAVFSLLPDTVGDDMCLAGNPSQAGFPAWVPKLVWLHEVYSNTSFTSWFSPTFVATLQAILDDVGVRALPSAMFSGDYPTHPSYSVVSHGGFRLRSPGFRRVTVVGVIRSKSTEAPEVESGEP
jgi:hypothetical protein